VHDAGIYNGILAGGFLWAELPGIHGYDVARVMLLGGGRRRDLERSIKVAGTAVQAAPDIAGVLPLGVRSCRPYKG
jgi:hypothetical protein